MVRCSSALRCGTRARKAHPTEFIVRRKRGIPARHLGQHGLPRFAGKLAAQLRLAVALAKAHTLRADDGFRTSRPIQRTAPGDDRLADLRRRRGGHAHMVAAFVGVNDVFLSGHAERDLVARRYDSRAGFIGLAQTQTTIGPLHFLGVSHLNR